MPQMMRSTMSRPSRSAAAQLWIVAGCLFLTGCGGVRQAAPDGYQVKEPQTAAPAGGYKVGKPYQIQGVWYYPNEDYAYDETGIASWYGPDFHGKYTANGDVFDQNAVSAAHRTLPMPSIVKVTNLDNGRSIEVKVNDRGPFAHGRILDLSKHAAELLGMDMQGTARVRVQIMADESRALALQLKSGDAPPIAAAPSVALQAETLAPPKGVKQEAPGKAKSGKPVAPPPSGPAETAVASTPAEEDQRLAAQTPQQVAPKATQIYIQAGAFTRYDNANRVSSALSGVWPATISQVHTKGGPFFRVRLGPLASVSDADALLEKVISSGYPDARVVVD
jgi:rare lipoprotein A